MKCKIVPFIIVLAAVPALCEEPIADANGLLKFLVEKNEAAWAKIEALRSIQYTEIIERSSSRSKAIFKDIARIKRQGKCLYSRFQESIFVPSTTSMQEVKRVERQVGDKSVTHRLMLATGPRSHEKREKRLVINDKYSVYALMGNLTVSWRDHSSVAAARKDLNKLIQMNTPKKLMAFCFGERHLKFRDTIKQLDARMQYDAIKLNDAKNQPIYQIRRRWSGLEDGRVCEPDMIWIIDPDSGYLATEVIFNPPKGAFSRHWTFEAKQISEGVWYPVECAEKRIETKGGVSKQVFWYKSRLDNIVCNAEIPASQFTVESLQLNQDMPEAIVVRTKVDGQRIPYVFEGDTLVPERSER